MTRSAIALLTATFVLGTAACGVEFVSEGGGAGGTATGGLGGSTASSGGAGGAPSGVGGATSTGGGAQGGAGGKGGAGGHGGSQPMCGALAFDGVDDVVIVPDDPALDGLANITVEAWIRPQSYPSEVHILSHHNHNSATGYVLLIYGGGEMQFRYHFNGITNGAGYDLVTPQVWHHVAATYDGQFSRLYIDGARVHEQDIGVGLAQDAFESLAIGRAAYDDNFHFHGRIESVRLSNVARYTEESFTPGQLLVDADTVALWDFEGSGQTITDGTGQHDGTLGADANQATDDPARIQVPCPYEKAIAED